MNAGKTDRVPPRARVFPTIFACATICLLPAGMALAQSEPSPFSLSVDDLLKVKVVTAARREQRPFDSPRSIAVVTAAEIRRRNYRSTPEAVQEIAGVLLQQTNDGGGSPIIRGLVGNQVLLLVDGVRMNNAIYRFGPNQYLNTIDIEQVERIEVICGPGSVLFGSDALGGVINIITKSRVVGDAQPNQVEVHARTATADRGTLGRVALSAGTRRLSAVGGVSLKSFGRIVAGGGATQQATGYDEWAADVKLSAVPRPEQTITVTGQVLNQSDVLRADALNAGTDLEWRWDPQRRTLAAIRYANTAGFGFVRELSVMASYQDQSERAFRRTSASPSVRRESLDGDRTLGVGIQIDSAAPRNQFTYGFESYGDSVRSTRVDTALGTGAFTSPRGTYADGASRASRAAYVQDQVQLAPRLSVDLGGRYEWVHLRARLLDPATGTIDVDTRNRALTGSAYASLTLAKHVKLVGGGSNGFRAPNVDDVSILGSFGGGFEVPNPTLTPERSVSSTVGLKVLHARTAINVAVYEARYRGLIVRAPDTSGGLPFLDLNHDGTRNGKEPLLFRRENLGRSSVRGVEMDGQVNLSRAWRAGGTIGWTHGTDDVSHEPLRREPPTHGSLRLTLDPARSWWLEAYTLFAWDQRRLNSGDIVDVRIGPYGTPGFSTLNLRGGAEVPHVGTVTIGLENLGDAQYKWHGSGIDRPGRDLVVGLRRAF